MIESKFVLDLAKVLFEVLNDDELLNKDTYWEIIYEH